MHLQHSRKINAILQIYQGLRFSPIALFIICFGCSSVHYLPENELENTEFTDDLIGKKTRIVYKNDQIITGELININTIELEYSQPDSGKNQCIPVQDVQLISIKNYNKGMGQGAGLGFLIGATAGILVVSSGSGSSGWGPSQEVVYGVGIIIGGPLIGFIAGGIIGAEESYIFGKKNLSDEELNKLTSSEKYISVPIDNITAEGVGFITFIWKGQEFTIRKSNIHKIDKSGKQTILYLSPKIYNNVFLKP